ncbi:MAG TPA: carbohydrate ABC transporter permease [Roseiflexaceae bacterium]|jgi:multiple sugar transport system permease protein|nr:carbohydrate ABC transporter permease [Roseiflexaceae bacterium]
MATKVAQSPSRVQNRHRTRAIKHASREILTHIVLIPAAFLFLLPFLWMLSTSLKPDAQLYSYPPVWIPHPFQWANYPKSVTYVPFFLYLRNTVVISVASMIGVIFSSSLVSYSLARIPWPGRHFLFLLTIATLMLPFQVTLIPVFLVFKNLGWVGDLRPLIVPQFFGHALYIFLLRQFFMSIPMELSEAARIDGANEFRIFWSVIMPLAKPALATVAVFQFIRSWTDYLNPLIYLNDQNLYTLQLGLYQYSSQYGREWGLLMSAAVLITLPPIITFFFTQRTFVQGVTLTGIKG